jgi:hypothetical protein
MSEHVMQYIIMKNYKSAIRLDQFKNTAMKSITIANVVDNDIRLTQRLFYVGIVPGDYRTGTGMERIR